MEIKKKKSKKKFIIPIVIGGVLVLGIAGAAIGAAVLKNAPKQVNITHATEGELKQQVVVSGAIESDSEVTYYAPSSIKIEDIVETGTQVAEGDLLLEFDEEEYNYYLRLAEIQDLEAQNSYGSKKYTRSDTASKLKEANNRVVEYSNRVVVQQSIVDALESEVNKASKDAQLNAAEIKTKINSKNWELTKKTNELISQGKTKDEITAATAGLEKDLSELSSFLDQNNTASKDLVSKQQQLEDANKALAELKGKLDEAKLDAKGYEGASLNSYDSKNIDLDGEYTTMQTHRTYSELLKYASGLHSEGNGVVIRVGAMNGATPLAGSELLTVASLDKLHLTVNVGKNDLKKLEVGQKATIKVLDSEYEGVVRSISKLAVATNNGAKQVTATIEITNPDANICLGLDGKATIRTKEVANCIMLPVESVYTDNTGDFIYIVNADKVLEKKYVTVGISSADYVEIIDGVSLEEQVVTTIPAGVEEGMTVVPVDMGAISEALGMTAGSGEISE